MCEQVEPQLELYIARTAEKVGGKYRRATKKEIKNNIHQLNAMLGDQKCELSTSMVQMNNNGIHIPDTFSEYD